MNNNLLIGYLCYLNDENKGRRGHNFYKSLESMSLLNQQPCKVIAIKNNCSKTTEMEIDNQAGIDYGVSFNKNFWDISVIYSCAKLAKDNNLDYCCYMYDDFVVYNDHFVNDSISFMDQHKDVACLRIPQYNFQNMDRFDTRITSKSKNPDAIRHYNTVTNQNLNWEGPYNVGHNVFYKNNWHYTSRPTVWRTDILMSFFENMNEVPVMQFFEEHAANIFAKTGLKTAVLDGGAMYTFLESERNRTPASRGQDVRIKLSEIDSELIREVSGS
jgi:hypothetical protein